MKGKGKKIEFSLPEGFVVPESSSKVGDQFETLATIQVKSDGKACLVALDGYRMPGYANGDDRSYEDAASEAMEAGASQQQQGVGGY
jgi:hypothetical protein